MKKITAITAQKRRKDRINIFLDGEFAFSLSRITAAWLKTGDLLTEEKILKLQAEEARERAYQQALLYLGYRSRSEKEIRQNLQKHEVPEEVIEETLERLRVSRLADDGLFARQWVENRSTFRPRGKRALEIELRQKGISQEAIRESLTDVDEEALAYEAASKRAGRYKSLEWDGFKKKLSDFLARRGFSYSISAPVVSKVWNETHADTHSIDEDEDTP